MVEKKDTNIWLPFMWALKLLVHLQIFHKVEYLQCNELFVINISSMNMVLHKFVWVVNEVSKSQIQWPQRGGFVLGHGKLQKVI